MQIDRYTTIMDCGGMSLSIYKVLQKMDIPSILIIGDMSIDGQLEYKTIYQYLEDELKGIKSETVKYHVWILVENHMLIDPTIKLKKEERTNFLSKKTDSSPFICNIRNLPQGIEYIPLLIDEEFLLKTNACQI